jgi:hypothetical protein
MLRFLSILIVGVTGWTVLTAELKRVLAEMSNVDDALSPCYLVPNLLG